MGDGFYKSKDPTNSIKVKDNKEKANNKIHICTDTKKDIGKISTTSPLVYTIIWSDY